jgi:hypothetical protein
MSAVQNLSWSRDYLNGVTICGRRWTWFCASNTKVHPHFDRTRGAYLHKGSHPRRKSLASHSKEAGCEYYEARTCHLLLMQRDRSPPSLVAVDI